MARANAVLEVSPFSGNGQITFTVLGAGSVVFDARKASQANQQYAAYHGFKQRLSDCIVSVDNPADKLEAIRELANHYESGSEEWRVKTAGEGRGDNSGVTIAAVARVQGCDVGTITAKIATMAEKKGVTTKAILASLAKSPDVIRAMAEIRAEKSKAGDGDDLLAELMG